jgi:SlyX protein
MGEDARDALRERFEALETKASFQDRTIDTLNEVVTAQQNQIDRLDERVRKLEEIAHALEPGGVDPDEEPPPPHY